MASGMPKVLLVELFKDMPVTTLGTSEGVTILNLEVPQIRGILPKAASLALYGLVTEVAATDFEFNVAFIPGFDRNHEVPGSPFNIASAWFDATPTGGSRSADYATLGNFLPEARLQAVWRNKLNITGVKNARISAMLIVTLLT